ncbi:MAG: ribonuclease P protein component 4 [Candidatus Helarchaeota archaeon]
MSKRKIKKTIIRTIAKQRISTLFHLADEQIFKYKNKEKANRYVYIAKRISMKSNVKIPRQYKRRICSNCQSYMIPGINCRVRIKKRRTPHVVYTCLECYHKKRYVIRKRNENEKNKKS